ncbi:MULTISPECIES: substrate-binding domain-containing protein [unclassified Arcicella]|uniref:LacI family DNA-binding transcriptional regulator n=1 Tax=unclassified Arcicella TaxID=2644986 RepID=UPI0028611FEC|nr:MULTISPECIES: substrate-binding domain-containing protein [unclassified Arcicella]MDR6564745.1 LacI family transcriptional regulator [Arcicella sp. BE51]MDR6814541.1 LacI family transcriptional regulator [Arcicella sp. BE140]MDR6825871.1 LacI family transcriptional regulator [Arcicella sp. BE139]
MKKMSIKAVAETLKISTATVSYILNGKAKEKRISEELTKRVLAYVEENNFKPNHLAKSLRTGKTNVIGLIVEDIADPFFASVAGNIENIAYENGYKIIYSSTKNNPTKAKELINTFRERNVDGYIITPTEGIESDITQLINSGLPVVLFDRNCTDIDVSYVGMDNFDSAYKAVKHLIAQNYKNIALITLDSSQAQMIDRLLGYEKAIFEKRIPSIIKKFDYSSAKIENITEEIGQFLIDNPSVDAIFFATNYLAMSGIELLNRKRIKIGKEIGIMVFDDNDLFRIHQPSISAIAQPIQEMSKQLINTLLVHMENSDKYLSKEYILPASIILRDSSSKHEIA